jgi:hypothetical protein
MGKDQRAPNQLSYNKDGLGSSVENRQLSEVKDGRTNRTDGQLHEVFPVDAAALRMLDEESELIIKKLFSNAEVKWKIASKDNPNPHSFQSAENIIRQNIIVDPYKTTAASGYSEVKQITNNLVTPGLIMDQYKKTASTNKFGIALNTSGAVLNTSRLISPSIQEFITDYIPKENQDEVLVGASAFYPSIALEWMISSVPFSGLAVPLGSALWNASTALKKKFAIKKINEHENNSFAGVTATQAIDAMKEIIERERKADIYSLEVSLCEFGGKLVSALIDGGTFTNATIGLAANIAKLANIVRIINNDVNEKNAVNKAIQEGKVELKIFSTCPLLGCYLLCCAPTSVIMNRLLKQVGDFGWKAQAEQIIKEHITPLRKNAWDVINNHRFEIPSLMRFQGMGEVNKAELKRMGIIS